jgi:hypothetical protein
MPHRSLLHLSIGIAFALSCTLPVGAQNPVVHPQASSIETVYILPSSHWDLGFLRTPEDEQAAMKPHLDSVLAACAKDPEFRWTIENVWQLNAWLERTPDQSKVREMRARIASGQIEVSASWGSMHTEFQGTEELNRLDDEGRHLAEKLGLRGDMAMEDDVPGFSLRLPQVLARSGVRYLVNGSNTFIGGGTSISPKVAPFFWASPNGSRVLTWTTRGEKGGYTEGLTDYYLDPQGVDPYSHTPFYPKEWNGVSNDEIMERGVQKLLAHYMDAGYRGRTIAVLFMHDGIGPEYEVELLQNVRRWNRQGRHPYLRVATPREYFHAFTDQELAAIPTYTGDWSGLWAQSKTGSPAMSADARYVQEAIPIAEEAASLAEWNGSLQASPEDVLHRALINLMRYDEHNGAGNGGWPKVLTESEVNRSNLEYATYIQSARKSAEQVLDQFLPDLVMTRTDRTSRRYVTISNMRSWPQTDLVNVDVPAGSFIIRDAISNEAVPTQRQSPDRLSFLAKDVPALGYKTYFFERADSEDGKTVQNNAGHAENERYAVDVNDAGAVLRILDKKTSQDIFAGHGPEATSSRGDGTPAGSVKIVHQSGPVEDRITVLRPASWWPETVISLPRGMNEVRIEEVLDRTHMPEVAHGESSELYSIRFPFRVNNEVQKWIDDGIGFHLTPQASLPGARLDGVVPRFVIALAQRGTEVSHTLLFAQQESFFVTSMKQTGDINVLALLKSDTGETKDHGVVRFRTFEPGYPPQYSFHFRISNELGIFDPVAAYQFGRSEIVPLQARLLPAHTAPKIMQRSYLSISARNVVMDDLRFQGKGCAGCYLLRLQEIEGKDTTTSVSIPGHAFTAVQTDITGTDTQEPVNLSRVHLSPYETLTLSVKAAR